MKSGKVWLLLDGVDEMAVDNPLQHIASQLKEGWTQNVRVVLTCRLNVWDANKQPLHNFDIYKNLPFELKQVNQFICKWYENSNPEMGQQLQGVLNQPGKERIRDLVRTPLRLALLCYTWQRRQGELPQTNAGLYERFVEAFYEWNKGRVPITLDKEKRSLLNRALGDLALQAIDNNESQSRLREKFISDRLGDPEQEGSLFWLVRLLGWLNQVGVAVEDPDEKVYAFYHATFEEYFAALAIADWHFFLNHVPHNPAQGTYRLFEPQWKEVILLWLGREDVAKEQKEEFIEALYAFDQGCGELYAYQALFLAAAGIAEFKDYDSVDKVVYPLIELGFGNSNTQESEWYNFPSWISKAARAALQETDQSCAADALTDLISTEPRPARFSVRTAFEDLVILQPNSPSIVSHLLTWLDSADSDLWYNAILKFKKIGTVNLPVINGLLKWLRKYYEDEINNWRSDQSRAVRWGESWSSYHELYSTLCQRGECLEPSSCCDEVASAIGEIDPGNSEAVKLLIDLIRSAWDTPFGIYAALNLENIDSGNPEAINILTEFLQPTNNQFSRWQATKGLLNIAPKNPKVVRLLKDFLESLLQSSQNKYICKEAAKALIIIDPDHSEAIRLLIGELYTSLQTRRALIEKEIAEILEETPEETEQLSDIPLPPTIEHWKGNEFDDILQRVTPGNREASSSLVELIKTCENQGARYIAASLLGKIGTDSSDVVDTLISLQSNTEYPDARILAANSLWKIQPDNSHTIDTLVELIQSSQDRRIQAWAVRSMKDIGTDSPGVVIDALINLLHSNGSFCNEVVDFLGEIGTGKQKVIAALTELWEVSKNGETRKMAAENLVKIGVDNPEVTDDLVHILLTDGTTSAMWKLKKIISSRLFPLVVSHLRKYRPIEHEVYGEVLWYCAQNMTYPAFYQAWHHPQLTPYPEVLETTGVDTNTEVLRLNLENLPQYLREQVANDLDLRETVREICINSYKFIARDNPAARIYTEMVRAGCPKCEDGTPKNMVDLQAYWDLLKSDCRTVLVF